MATKKQKRQAAEEKRERFMAEYKRTGLEAQKRDRQHRESLMSQAIESAERRKKNMRQYVADLF